MKTLLPTRFFAISCAALPALAQPSPALAPAEAVEGLSQTEWSRAWWQWAASFDRDNSPVGDRNGALCDRGQSGPVWFLAGTYGTQRTVRTCKIPQGKYLLPLDQLRGDAGLERVDLCFHRAAGRCHDRKRRRLAAGR